MARTPQRRRTWNRPSRQDLEDHAPEGPDVGALVDRLPSCLLRAHVLTGNVTFVMGFSIEVFGTATLDLGAFAGSGSPNGVGPRTVSGKQIVSIVFNNVPAAQQVFGHVAQTGGANWRWFQTRISYLPVLVSV